MTLEALVPIVDEDKDVPLMTVEEDPVVVVVPYDEKDAVLGPTLISPTTSEETHFEESSLESLTLVINEERTLRKRKEKALVKLAKELNKRSHDAELKGRKLTEYSKTVASLETQIEELETSLKSEQNLHRQVARESSERVNELETTTVQLRHQILALQKRAERLQAQVDSKFPPKYMLITVVLCILLALYY